MKRRFLPDEGSVRRRGIRRLRRVPALPLLCLALGILVSCEESLPPYEPPTNVLGFVAGSVVPAEVQYWHPWWLTPKQIPSYTQMVRFHSSNMAIRVSLRNEDEETLQDKANVHGNVTFDYPLVDTVTHSIYAPSAMCVIHPLDVYTGLVTVDPGESLWVDVWWDYRLSNKVPVFINSAYTDEISWTYLLGKWGFWTIRTHQPMMFYVRIRLQIFDAAAPVQVDSLPVTIRFVGIIGPEPP